jgi:hypothetical protein
MSTDVDTIYEHTSEVFVKLLDAGDISLAMTLDALRAKSLLLASASYYEVQLTGCVRNFCVRQLGYPSIISNLVESKAISRQYHTWFDWKTPNAGPFFALFGKGFSSFMKTKIAEDRALGDGISDFLQLGVSEA